MRGHTLAPWICDKEGLVAGRDPERPESPSFDIFDVEEWPGTDKEAWANAKLIAAAPEMLEALEIIASGGEGQFQWSMTKAEALARKVISNDKE